MQHISLIDISTLGKARPCTHTQQLIRTAFHDIGFMYVVGHGISDDVIGRVREALIEYFNRPRVDKLRYRICRDNYRGYIPLGFFTPNAGPGAGDNYEGYKLHFDVNPADPIRSSCDLYGPNKWPAKAESLRKSILAYWSDCDRVATQVLTALVPAFDIACDTFLKLFEYPLTNMTLLHYPALEKTTTSYGIHPHKDTDALTILPPDPVGGLMVKRSGSDEWITLDAPADALIINIGDLLELWSGGYFVSTPHKVVNISGKERYSYPYFVVPRFDTVVRPLRDVQPGFDRIPVQVGDVSREVWRTNWPDTAPTSDGFDLGTLAD